MALATLSIDLVAKLASLEAGLDKAGRLAQKQADAISSSFAGIKLAAVGIGAALGSAFSVVGITGFIRATVDGLDRLNDLSDATGASIENLSALEDIAARTGTSMDTVGDSVVKLNKVLGEASKPGSDAANALAAIGLNAEALKKLDPAEALRQVAVALAGFADDGNKARIVQELFGKSIQQVAPLLKDLAEAGKLNATVTTEQAKATEDFNKQLAALQKNTVDVARDVSGPLVNALNGFLAKAREASDTTKTFQERLASLFTAAKSLGAGALLGLSNEDTNVLASARTDLEAIERALQRTDLTDQRRSDLEAKRIGRLETINRLQKEGFRPSQNYGDAFKPTLAGLAVAPPKALKAEKVTPFVSNSFNEDDVNALKALGGTDVAKVRELQSALSGLFELQRETRGDATVIAAIAKVRAELEKLDPAAQAAAEAKKRLDDLLSKTPSSQLGEVLIDINLLNKAFENGAISVEKWAEGVRVATAKLPDAVKEPLEEIDAFTKQAAANIQDALGDGLLKAFEGNTKGVEDVFKDMLKRMAAQAAAAQLGKFLLGDTFGQKGGSLGGIAGSIIGFLGGLPGRASGGPVSGGRPYIVGERGRELFVPSGNGNVISNDGMMGGGASVILSPNIRIDARSDAAQVAQLVAAGMAQAQQSMWRQLKARGIA